jgi:hypothetical protein
MTQKAELPDPVEAANPMFVLVNTSTSTPFSQSFPEEYPRQHPVLGEEACTQGTLHNLAEIVAGNGWDDDFATPFRLVSVDEKEWQAAIEAAKKQEENE